MKRSFLLIVLLFICFLYGCSDSSPVATQVTSGEGFKIRMVISSDEISSGGSVSIDAYITSPNGSPVSDEDEAVSFTSTTSGMDFSDELCDVKSGVAHTILTWKDESSSDNPAAPSTAQIVASYRGALCMIQVMLIASSY